MRITNQFLVWKRSRVKAFTLLECMVALIILAGAILVYQGMTKSLFSNMNYLAESDQDKWLLFSQQLRGEFNGASFKKLEGDKLYLEKDGKAIAFGLNKNKDFKKSNANGHGYNPMLLKLQDAQIRCQEKEVTIRLQWKSGLERVFIYDFNEAG